MYDNLSGQKLNNYTLGVLLGKGGMGAVYESRQGPRRVAVKVLPVEVAQHPDYVARFNREIEIALNLEHPHIVRVYDYGVDRNISYVVMHHLPGGTLERRLQKFHRPSFRETRHILQQLGSALDYAHQKGIVHRDIKASNVMFDDGGNAYLTDFGVARLMQEGVSTLTATGQVIGTPAYMAPEQWTGATIDARTDVYALGVMVYRMLTGEMPFSAPTPHVMMHRHLNETPTPPAVIQMNLPPGTNVVMEKALAKRPADRFNSAGEFVTALSDALVDIPSAEQLENTFTTQVLETSPTAIDSPRSGTPPPLSIDEQKTFTPGVPPVSAHQIEHPHMPQTVPSSASGGGRKGLWLIGISLLFILVVAVLLVVALKNGDKEKETANLTATPISTPMETEAIETTAEVIPSETPIGAPIETEVVEATAEVIPSETPIGAPIETEVIEATEVAEATEEVIASETATGTQVLIDTPIPSEIPSNTPRPSNTPEPTDTATPSPTPSRTPRSSNTPRPTEVSAVMQDIEVTWIDDFSGSSLSSGWTVWQRQPELKDGLFIFEGADNWNDGITRPTGWNRGILQLFKYQPGAIEFSIESGDWEASSFHSVMLSYYEGAWIVNYSSGRHAAVYEEVQTDIKFKSDTWYYLLIRIVEGQFYFQVWEKDNPAQFVLDAVVEPDGDGWDTRFWDFGMKVYSGTLILDFYEELRFPENYIMPDTPPEQFGMSEGTPETTEAETPANSWESWTLTITGTTLVKDEPRLNAAYLALSGGTLPILGIDESGEFYEVYFDGASHWISINSDIQVQGIPSNIEEITGSSWSLYIQDTVYLRIEPDFGADKFSLEAGIFAIESVDETGTFYQVTYQGQPYWIPVSTTGIRVVGEPDAGEVNCFWVEDFSNFSQQNYHYSGTGASLDEDNEYFYLLDGGESEIGRLFPVQKIVQGEKWTVRFDFLIKEGTTDFLADGFVFAFTPRIPLSTATRATGGSLGFLYGRGFVYGVEFDLFPNEEYSDPPEPHIAVLDGDIGKHIQYEPQDFSSTNTWQNVEIRMDNGLLDVWMEDERVLSTTIPDYDASQEGYFGFSAASGGFDARIILDNIQMCQGR